MSEQRVRQHYTGSSGEAYNARRAIPEIATKWVSQLRAEKLSPYIETTGTVLEYGVGSGWNLLQIKARRRIAFDISDKHAETLNRNGIEFVPATSSLADGSIDVVICHHTLEHVLNPPEVLREIHRLLRKPGKLLLFVPFEKERRYRHYDPDEPNHHLFSWNVQTLGNLVSTCDFQILEAGVGEFGYDRFASVWADKLKIGESGFRVIRRLAHLLKPGREVRIIASRQ